MKLANVASLGLYKHRESLTTGHLARLDTRRQFQRHTKFLQEVVSSGPLIEVTWRIEDVRGALQFLADHVSETDDKAARLIGRVFMLTGDRETRELCLLNLKLIDSPVGRKELVKISVDPKIEEEWRSLIAKYLEPESVDEPVLQPRLHQEPCQSSPASSLCQHGKWQSAVPYRPAHYGVGDGESFSASFVLALCLSL
ncbi:MAG: hypothetical protein WKF84_06830 [Pyrinomonadaceae bacterium]